MRDYLALHHGDQFDSAFGKGTGKAIMHATAGRFARPKVNDSSCLLIVTQHNRYRRDNIITTRRPQNQTTDKPRSIQKSRLLSDRSRRRNGTLPRGRLDGGQKCAGLICGMHAFVLFVSNCQLTHCLQLFGGSAFAKEKLYKLTDYNTATWLQNFVASIAGASASLIVSAPLDVIKTRIQNRNFENPESGFKIVSSMMKNEGITSFFKGLTPKLLMTGPKLVFSFWLAQTLIPAFNKVL